MSEQIGASRCMLKWMSGNRADERALRLALVPLRLMVAAIFIAHGLQKLIPIWDSQGFSGTVEMMGGPMVGLQPAALWAGLLVLAELGGGILLLIGLAPRLAATAIFIVMVGALLTAHRGQNFFETHLQQMILAATVTIMMGGSGALSAQKSLPCEMPAPASQEDEGE